MDHTEDIKRSPLVGSLVVYNGSEMSGKTHEIQAELKKFRHSISLNVAEDFTPSKLIKEMEPLLSGGGEIGVHLKVSPYSSLKVFGRFFSTLISWGVLEDEKTGEIRKVSDNVRLNIFVEVEAAPDDDKECECHTTDEVIKTIPGLYFMKTKTVTKIQREYVLKPDELILARLYCAYKHGNFSRISSTCAAMNSTDAATEAEKKEFLDHIKSLSRDIAIQSRLVRFYKFMYDWVKTYVEEARKRAREWDMYEDDIKAPSAYCQIFDEEVKQQCSKNITMELLHLNIGTSFAPDLINFRDETDNIYGMEAQTRGKVNTSAKLRHCLSTGFSDEGIQYIIHQHGYALTPDFVIKILTINDFRLARKSVVLSGDTGTGKTELLTIFSELINTDHKIVPDMLREIKDTKGELVRFFKKTSVTLKDVCDDVSMIEDKDVDAFRTAVANFTRRIVSRFTVINPSELMSKVLGCFTAQGAYNEAQGKELLKTKADLVGLVGDLGRPKFKGLLLKIVMHPRLSGDDFRARIREIEEAAKKLESTSATVVAFIDECTSTSIMSLVKEVLMDRSLDGRPLQENVMWIGAFNRNNGKTEEEKHSTESGVRPPPKSFEYAELRLDAILK